MAPWRCSTIARPQRLWKLLDLPFDDEVSQLHQKVIGWPIGEPLQLQLCLLHKPFGFAQGILDAIVPLNQGDNVLEGLWRLIIAADEAFDDRRFIRRGMLQCDDSGKGNFALPQVTPHRFAEALLLAGEVQGIINELKRAPEGDAEAAQAFVLIRTETTENAA